jgi:uncharacterized RDD family membrane protein YckC
MAVKNPLEETGARTNDVDAGPGEGSSSLTATSSRSLTPTGEESALFAKIDHRLLLSRAGAGAVDFAVWLCIGAVLFTGARALSGFAPLHGSAQDWAVLVLLPVVFMSSLLALIYAGLFSSLSGRTPGMMIFGLKVADSTGARPPAHRAFIRAGLFIMGLLPLGIGLLPLAAGQESFLDRCSGTTVTRV